MAMVFPGQGYQKIDLLYQLSKEDIIIKETFQEASEYLNYNLWSFIQHTSIKDIKKYQYIQSFIFVASISIYRLWKKLGGSNPTITAGHSLGEYAALVCGESIKFSDTVKFIKKREKIIIKYIKKTSIAMKVIIGLDEKIIMKLCKKNSNKNIVNIASINSNTQIVISGHKIAVEKTSLECKKMGAKLIMNLPINFPAHCSIMKKISKKIFRKIKKISIKNPIYPILNSISVKQYMTGNNIRNALVKQLYQTVNWKKTINIIKSHANIILEVGISNILTNLNKNKSHSIFLSINNIKNFFLALKLL